jgi:hypothetical protein
MTNPNDRSDTSNLSGEGDTRRADPNRAAVDPQNAATQEQVRADHDALQESARRVESSVSSAVRDNPVGQTSAAGTASEDTTEAVRNGDAARANADAARDSARTRTNPEHAETDPRNAAQQDQMRADHDALQQSARRVEQSVSADVRDTPVRQTNDDAAGRGAGSSGSASDGGELLANAPQTSTDPHNAAQQDRVHADHDALQESARRVEQSVSADVRNTPVQPATGGTSSSTDSAQSLRNLDDSRENADAARESARRVDESVSGSSTDRDRR